MSKVLVTGGAGFIGSHLCEALIERGDQAFVIDDLSTGRMENLAGLEGNPAFHFTAGTILNYQLLESLVRMVDRIFHLAAVVGVQKIIDVPVDTIEINVLGAHNVLTLAARYRKPCLVASTSEVYGPTTKSRWGYACSKAIDEFLALAYFRSKKLPVTIARLFNTTGPRQTGRYGMVLPRFVEQALRGEAITVFGSGKQSRCFADVSDVVAALIMLTDISEAAGQVFNIGNPEEVSIADLARLVRKLIGSPSPITFIPYDEAYQPGFEDMQRRVPNIDKLSRLTGFKPKVGLVDIVKRVIASKQQEMEAEASLMPGLSAGAAHLGAQP